METKEITICLHCGCDQNVVDSQIESLRPLEETYKIHWNNRIDRHPGAYDSYSELINDSIVSSPTETVILINDRTRPKSHEVEKIIRLLEGGFAAATMYSVGFMGLTKELIRHIGWWDERFYGAGYEDDDFVLRLRMNDLAYYESEEADYDMHWQTPLRASGGEKCSRSEPWFKTKWHISDKEIRQMVDNENYTKYEGKLGPSNPEIKSRWMKWNQSVIGYRFAYRMQTNRGGQSRSYWFMDWSGTQNETKKVVK